MCRYESLKDGTVDLADIALMNEELDAAAENENRVTEWLRRNGGRHGR